MIDDIGRPGRPMADYVRIIRRGWWIIVATVIVVADATCNTGARHPLATSITVAALGTHAMLPGNHFAQYAAQMIALAPDGTFLGAPDPRGAGKAEGF